MVRIWVGEDKRRKNEQQREHYRNNTAKYRSRETDKLARATPKWLTEDHWAEMNAMYKRARELGLTVDHIEPIDGTTSCGLHVPWNLQIISLSDSIQKAAKNDYLPGN